MTRDSRDARTGPRAILETLQAFAAAIQTTRSTGELLHETARCLEPVAGFSRLALAIPAHKDHNPPRVYFSGLKEDRFESMSQALDERASGWSVPLFLNHGEDDPSVAEDERLAELRHGALAILPLSRGHERLGLLIAGRPGRSGRIPDAIRQFLLTLSSMLSLALHRHVLPSGLEQGPAACDQVHHQDTRSTLGLLFASIAHEINNPLAGIMGYADALMKGEVAPEVRDQAERILKETERVRKIMRSILGFARSGGIIPSPVNMSEMILDVMRSLEGELERHRIRVDYRLSPACVAAGDADLLRQALGNVVHNAIHALEEQPSDRKIEAGCGQQEGQVVVWISDNGPGIRGEDLESIFQPFVTTKEQDKGTGLGLFIAGNIIESHGGNIRAESVPGAGTTFRIRIPAADADLLKGAKKETPAGLRTSILVVDDEEAIRDSLKELLTRKGHTVDTAGSSSEALAMMARSAYRVIVFDVRLPDANTVELYRRMDNMEETVAKTIFMTGDTSDEKVADFLRTTSARCLNKPFRPQDLFTKIEEVLRSSPRKKSNHFAA